jgi:hypothetical protein
MSESYSIEALNDLSLLTRLVIKFGGDFPLFADRRRMWLRAKVNGIAASATGPMIASQLVEPTKDYFLDMAALAANLHKQLIKHAEHHATLPVGANDIARDAISPQHA